MSIKEKLEKAKEKAKGRLEIAKRKARKAAMIAGVGAITVGGMTSCGEENATKATDSQENKTELVKKKSTFEKAFEEGETLPMRKQAESNDKTEARSVPEWMGGDPADQRYGWQNKDKKTIDKDFEDAELIETAREAPDWLGPNGEAYGRPHGTSGNKSESNKKANKKILNKIAKQKNGR